MNILRTFFILLSSLIACTLQAQELDARVTVNHSQVEGTNVSVFEQLEERLTDFINQRQWTDLQFKKNERINCNFSITVKKYDEAANQFTCSANISATRPVYNSSYNTTSFATNDNNFNFTFQEFDQLEFRTDQIDTDLTALIAYYAYLIIGIDLDTMSPMGGTNYLQTALDICNGAQSLTVSAKGWKAFDDGKNRYGIVNDWLDGGMTDFRKAQYTYHRQGLDLMTENSERARANITAAFEDLKKARENKSLSLLPQLWTEYKADEIVNIYQGHATQKEKEFLIELLTNINASKSASWNKIRSAN